MLVVVFLHSTSPAFAAAVHIAGGAPYYSVIGSGRGAMHIAGFEASRTDAARALALLNLIRDWKGLQVWCRGKQLVGHWNTLKVLDCYLSAMSCDDPRAHCVVTVDVARDPDRPGTSLNLIVGALRGENPIPEPSRHLPEYRAFPCRLASSGFHFNARHPSSYTDQAQAAAVRQGCDWCPRFDPSITGRVFEG
jgi:hypothetical protein